MLSWPPRAIRSCVGAGLPEEDEGGGVGGRAREEEERHRCAGEEGEVREKVMRRHGGDDGERRSWRAEAGERAQCSQIETSSALDLVGGVVGKGRGREGTYETGVGDKSGGKGARAARWENGKGTKRIQCSPAMLLSLSISSLACAENQWTSSEKALCRRHPPRRGRPRCCGARGAGQHGQHGQHAPSSPGPFPALLSASEGGGGCGDGCGDTMGHHGGKGGHFTLLRTLSVEVVYLVVYRGHHEGNGGHFTLLRTLSVEVVYLVVYRGHHVGKGGQKCRWGIWRCIWWCTGDTMGVKGDRSMVGQWTGVQGVFWVDNWFSRGNPPSAVQDYNNENIAIWPCRGISLEACGALLFCDMSQNNPFEIVSECQGIDDGLKAPVGALGLCVHGVQGTLALVQGTGYCWTLPVFVLEKWVIVTQGTPYLMI
ncbi:hypothetical protein C8F04DRAFT_1202223 [Mycena alexandri]|uniref:Uncharacterized protein n=1 Tax=Mycena alexandri TaxID=1745969 RepID=A0AAD6RW52_9AGAR|nr:hypothetical protein C8F04DRAFT_1202223 [Mycena alexandri]